MTVMTPAERLAKAHANCLEYLEAFKATGDADNLMAALEWRGLHKAKGDTSVGESASWYWEEIEVNRDDSFDEALAVWDELDEDTQNVIVEQQRDIMSEDLANDNDGGW